MNSFYYPLLKLNEYEQVRDCLSQKKTCQVTGCSDSQLAHFITGLSDGYRQKVIVTFSALKAKEIYDDIKGFTDDVVMYPSKDFIFFSADVHGNLILQQRLEFIEKIVEDKPFTVIVTADAFMDKIQPLDKIKDNYLEISEGSVIEQDALKKKLVKMGYEAVEQVDSPGQFAIRGSIIDIYTLTDEVPYRIDFWDDEVDIIKSFEIENQRSIENLESIKIYPATEYFFTEEEIKAGLDKIKLELNKTVEKFRKKFKTEEAHRLKTTVEEFITNMEINPFGVSIDSYVNYFSDSLTSLLEYFDNPIFFIDEPKRVLEQLNAVNGEFKDSMTNRLEKGYVLPGQTDVLWNKERITDKINSYTKVVFTAIAQKVSVFDTEDFVEVDARNISPYNNKFEMLVEDLKRYKKQKYSVLLVTTSATRGQRLAEDLRDFEISAFYEKDDTREVNPGEVMIISGRLRKGFTYPMVKFVAISDTDIFGERKKKRRKKHGYSGSNISSFSDLNIGDYVVHENHGLGIYRGIEKVEVDHVVKDYIKIEYAGGSNLYILATQLDMIQKYADSEAKKPKLNRLGGQEWNKTKSKVKKAVAEIAKELVELYAIRQNGQGYVFSPDTEWQKEFEEMFPFEETDDQLNAINEVKKDMESTKIMDRLICGDVGFGKTEIAIRAAFKAIQDNKQVAYLVPTTVLAQQHYKTFKQRFKDFPVRVEMLSRFRTKSNIDQNIRDLKKGYVDIVIGTHRLLSKDVKFKDLGLLIIDEEQRFGVKHKEQIKELKNNVDVITLTATPIPRTLHMSLIGIRDMCVMEEPPQDRMPIQTFVMEYNEEIARDAINRELARGGQVYFVHNRVQDIADMAASVQNMVPDANVAFAHGQMSERQLEEIMYDFVNGDIDVLVSTTIIETGLDIPNANTIIIHDAERMGLSQLYQLRGRVGRSNRMAYAFLMYSRNKMLTEVAEKRLGAIRDFTELGSGVKIAMRDLEIRGTGNLLGAQQSGHLEAVGYDLYCKMLNQAIEVLKGETPEEDFETKIDLMCDAFVPASYIKNETLKMDIYKRIAGIETDEEYEDMQDELIDRFGDIPSQVENLLQVVLLKAAAHKVYITEISGTKDKMKIMMWNQAKIDVERIPILVREYKGRLKFVTGDTPYFVYSPKPDDDNVIGRAGKLVESMSTLV
ncbi:transcription-repair coupling factor [Eubacterium sp. AF15-50]|uniref:transcription-repair coupling factor n=1 Tax=unclassified Eubacterium (in: firmicutes) TaxID=2624479 RepID=UPI000E530330|nr:MULTISPECIES: transcription-repair coupling factor [unclassified Eubacterium (in: firmicutes)]RHR70296.1 transcription-repair coupling factor [Eubacterium sp. AF16-48]RHR78834.1 transcription-repair coupling factor [Eubacterium sp. AF15-50]